LERTKKIGQGHFRGTGFWGLLGSWWQGHVGHLRAVVELSFGSTSFNFFDEVKP